MAYDRELADRIREVLGPEKNLSEKAMFGGLAFLINGNMAVSASGRGGLLLQVDPAETDTLVADPHADRFVMRGRSMNGWLGIDAAGIERDDDLRRWVTIGLAYARTLPAK